MQPPSGTAVAISLLAKEGGCEDHLREYVKVAATLLGLLKFQRLLPRWAFKRLPLALQLLWTRNERKLSPEFPHIESHSLPAECFKELPPDITDQGMP
jgi:hypothetical protein